jgi:anti-sigma regulatory factor (Ser/Thr protein kinase)/biotin operon repressor
MVKPGSTTETIRKFIKKHGSASGPALAEHLGITRQAVSLHLRRLIAAGEVFKTGSTRAARYYPGEAAPAAQRIRRDITLAGLDESTVYDDLAITLNFSRLAENVESVLHYAFTEMLNNAIDHSMSEGCTIEVRLDAAKVWFSVRDRGIGVFHSVAEKFSLEDEQAALIELIKGKTTTKPDAHSGEGIFFVSRSADRFVLRSHRLQIEWDHDRDDVFVSDPRYVKGTLVQFELRKDSRTRLEDVFAEFAPQEYDYRFEKTRVLVKLVQREYVSRSEAKRLLHNLDKFSEIELDMRDVTSVGQGFADEVFRVFASSHPEIVIRTINTGDGVGTMIRHVSGHTD